MKKLFSAQIIVLAAGTVFAWYTVVQDFLRFYNVEGTIFRVKECAVPNPVTTACFWGAWAFLLSLLWAIFIFRLQGERQRKHQFGLLWLLIAGTIFGWSNMTLVFIKFYSNLGNPPIPGCSGQLVTNPFITPCFIGSSLFTLGLIVVALVYRACRKQVAAKSPAPNVSSSGLTE